MAHMRLYKGTVPGIATGTEITNIGSDVIVVEGIYNSAATDGNANDPYNSGGGAMAVMLCVRCDAGFQVQNCTMNTTWTGYLMNTYAKATFWKPYGISAATFLGDGSANQPNLTDYKSQYSYGDGIITSENSGGPSCYLPSGAYIRQLNVGFILICQTGRTDAGVLEVGDMQDCQLNISFVEATYP